MSARLFVVHWQAEIGYEGQGSPISEDAARSFAADGNKRFKSIRHWVEPAETVGRWHPWGVELWWRARDGRRLPDVRR